MCAHLTSLHLFIVFSLHLFFFAVTSPIDQLRILQHLKRWIYRHKLSFNSEEKNYPSEKFRHFSSCMQFIVYIVTQEQIGELLVCTHLKLVIFSFLIFNALFVRRIQWTFHSLTLAGFLIWKPVDWLLTGWHHYSLLLAFLSRFVTECWALPHFQVIHLFSYQRINIK